MPNIHPSTIKNGANIPLNLNQLGYAAWQQFLTRNC
jgi:hypothetical protein